MATLKELSLADRLFLKAYPWRRIHPTPWANPDKSLGASRIALASSAGMVCKDQIPFDDTVRGGDPSFRWIAHQTPMEDLVETHRSQSFDHTGIAKDPNLALPLQRLNELLEQGLIGSINHRHASFMGSITAPGRMMRDTAPEIARGLLEDGVDRVLLVPV